MAAKPGAASDRQFWNAAGRDFADLGGAASTRSYREDEIRLLRRYFAAVPVSPHKAVPA